MTILDAFAILAFLKDEPAAGVVERLLAEDPFAVLTVLGEAEIIDHLVRLVGIEEDEAVLDLAQVGLGPSVVVDSVIAVSAGLLRSRSYHRTRCAVSLADCVAAEAARSVDARLATADPHLLDLCAREGIEVLALPDSSGNTWPA